MLLGLKPGVGLGQFALGKSLPEVLSFLQHHKAEFRCVELKWSEKEALARDILVSFPEHGFQLHFEPRSQRLRLVEVFDATRLQMVYGRAAVFGGASHAPTFGRIYEAFGPTYPGEPEAEGVGVALQYPGVMFLFPAPSPQQAGHALPATGPAGYGTEGAGRAAPSFPVPLSVVAERIYIHAGTRGPPAAVLAALPPPLDPGSHYMGPLEAVPCHGLFLGPSCGAGVRFGDSPQDVVSQLGLPARAVRKAGGVGGAGAVPDYFYTYPWRGLDLLFCGSTHRLMKAVLHTNVPGHPDFNAYCKCNFRVHQPCWRPAQVPQELHRGVEIFAGAESDGLDAAGYSSQEGPSDGFADADMEYAANGYSTLQPEPAAASGPRVASPKQDAGVGAGEGLLPGYQQASSSPHASQHALERQEEGPGAQQQRPQQQQAEEEGEAKDKSQPGGLSAAYQLVGQLVGLIDDVMTLDPQKLAPGVEPADTSEPEGSAGKDPVAAAPQEAMAGDAGREADAEAPAPAAASAGLGASKPPKAPTSAVAAPLALAPPPAATSKAAKKKAKKKKKGQTAAAAAPDHEESDSLADASASDSGFESSMASSPAASSPLTSHLVGPPRHRLGLAAGYQSSDWGSTADLAGKEGSVGVGSALDGWSDADDLLTMVAAGQSGPSSPLAKPPTPSCEPRQLDLGGDAGSSELAAGEEGGGVGFEGASASLAAWAAAPAPSAASALTAALSMRARLPATACASAGVQTVDVAVGDDAGGPLGVALSGQGELRPLADLEDAAGWGESGSPQCDYVLPDRPSLFDERSGAAEYERVPRQRDCSTQTPTHLLSPRPPPGGGAAGGLPTPSGLSAAAGGAGAGGLPASRAVVTADSRLGDIEAAFGHQGGPALHSRLGTSHPFGPTYLYAYRGVVFEVLQNGLIATVTLFKV